MPPPPNSGSGGRQQTAPGSGQGGPGSGQGAPGSGQGGSTQGNIYQRKEISRLKFRQSQSSVLRTGFGEFIIYTEKKVV